MIKKKQCGLYVLFYSLYSRQHSHTKPCAKFAEQEAGKKATIRRDTHSQSYIQCTMYGAENFFGFYCCYF